MPAFETHLFVCCNQRPAGHPRGCCDATGSEVLHKALKQAAVSRGLGPRVRVNKAGCLDQCELGPTVVIYPQGVWYGGVRPDDAEEIIERTVIGGETIARLQIPDAALNNRSLREMNPSDRATAVNSMKPQA